MKLTIYDTVNERYLSDDELEYNYFYTGDFIETNEGECEDTLDFRLNLLTLGVEVFIDGCWIETKEEFTVKITR